jgi:CubicO group peptidase (beta-lactamase class C family)
MRNTYFIIPNEIRPQFILRPADVTSAHWDQEWMWDWPAAAGGLLSSAYDMAIFCQMFLNGGAYGDVRILGCATVAAMTRNQIPGIGANSFGEIHPEANWGYGWNIYGGDNWKYYPGILMSPDSARSSGDGGVFMWVDPTNEIVGLYFAVTLTGVSTSDLFANAVTAAVDGEHQVPSNFIVVQAGEIIEVGTRR